MFSKISDFIKKDTFRLFLIGIMLLFIYFFNNRYITKFNQFELDDENVIAYTLDGVEGTGEFPKQNTGVEGTNVTCDNVVTATWDNSLWSIKITDEATATRLKCKVAFKTQETKTISGITFNLNTFSPDFSKSACSNCESKEAGAFATEDNYGTSYYYRGSVENNYVSFAGMTWRIIRINGDGTVRIILNGTTGTTAKFNSSYNNNAYIGYMYGDADSSTYNNTHANKNDSILKQQLDLWYENNLNTNYSSYLADSGFCGDRKPLTNGSTIGTGIVSSRYSGYGRVVTSTPSLKCIQSNDLYTTASSTTGNKALKYPVATITADEVLMSGTSGGVFDGAWNYTKENTSYLNLNINYWTMTPTGGYIPYDNGNWLAHVFAVVASGYIDDDFVGGSRGIRPVVNLKSDAIKYGTGTSSNPYRVTEN